MIFRTLLVGTAGLALVAGSAPIPLSAQTATVVRSIADTMFVVRIDGREYVAMRPETARAQQLRMQELDLKVQEMELDLQSARDSLSALVRFDELQRQELEDVHRILDEADQLLDIRRQRIENLEEQADILRRLGGMGLRFHIGGGATGSDRSPGILTGLSYKSVTLSGLLQERNSGLFLGMSFRVF